jgi:hypothetical protein
MINLQNLFILLNKPIIKTISGILILFASAINPDSLTTIKYIKILLPDLSMFLAIFEWLYTLSKILNLEMNFFLTMTEMVLFQPNMNGLIISHSHQSLSQILILIQNQNYLKIFYLYKSKK